MFASRYFAPRFFPRRYFGGAAAAGVELPALSIALFTLIPVLSMPPLLLSQVALGVDTLLRLRGVKSFDAGTGTHVLATGVTITARLAATPTGAAIDAALQLTLTERAAGDFHGTWQGSALETHLRAYLGERVFIVLASGGDFLGHRGVRVVDGVSLGG